jgi:hypothetical protein
MFPGFVGLIDRISKPILGTASEVVYHPAFPVPHGLVAALGVSVLRFPYSIPNRAGLTLPDVAARYTNMATTVENLVLSLQRLATGMSSDLKSDFRNIESIMDMLGIPQPTPVKWSSYQPTIQSQVILDVLTRRGMWVGADDVTGTDKYLMFPWLDDMSGMVEVRGYGDAPPDDVFIGGLGPLSVLSDKADTDISSTLYLLGICGYGVSAHATVASGSEVSKHRAIAGFSQEDGWAQVSSSYALNSNIQRSPLRNHQYSYAGQLSSTATVDMRVNDTVGYSGYVPVEDVGYHFLAWLSQTMNLPFLSG